MSRSNAILATSLRTGSNPDNTTASGAVSYTHLYGPQAGVRGYPTSEYIGSDGVMVRLVPGHADNETIKTVFESVK